MIAVDSKVPSSWFSVFVGMPDFHSELHMGYTPADIIERGGIHLLSMLNLRSPIRYSLFYDGSEKTSRQLEDAIGIDDHCREWYSAEHVIDMAVYQLSEQGFVQTIQLPENLPDGEPDYEIHLTDRGRIRASLGKKPTFFDSE